ncbi:hypothetical protein F8M41_016950 [Gigaspora margarita]|uniref:Uncharacterized protein n=1 Tax=Gigaspora margarita TaxID=4874 RepID=A0A8H4ANR1_GIGMA|nr:hypothetical protein F8M41_016950 [Gigaspora margarita]
MPCSNFEASTFFHQIHTTTIKCSFAYVLKLDQSSDCSSTELLDAYLDDQNCSSAKISEEYDSDVEESEELEEPKESEELEELEKEISPVPSDQEAFHYQAFGRTQLRSCRWRMNKASPTMRLKLLRLGGLQGRPLLSCWPAYKKNFFSDMSKLKSLNKNFDKNDEAEMIQYVPFRY